MTFKRYFRWCLIIAVLLAAPPLAIYGQPLHYRRTPDGRYQIYSVGWNGQDDGGIPGLYDSGSFDYRKGDLVWQYSVPAMPKVRSH